MFGRLLNYATSSLTGVMEKYAIRAAVVIPFVFALAFGLAGLTVILIDAFGSRDAYFLLAGSFAMVGLVAVLVVWLKERHDDQESSSLDASAAIPIATAAVKTVKQTPQAVVGGASEAATSFRSLAHTAVQNWPLVLAGAITIILLGGVRMDGRNASRHQSRY